jgi:hypothetical protein
LRSIATVHHMPGSCVCSPSATKGQRADTEWPFAWQKQNDELKDWTWVWVFWPYWMLASMCLAIAAWSTYRILGPGAGDADILQQSTTLRTYNIGFFLLLTLPLTGACYLDGLVSNQIAFMLPV